MDSEKLRTELVRKGIHFLVALAVPLASAHKGGAVAALAAGVLFYTLTEKLRLAGVNVPGVSALTRLASRPRDKGRFVLGPVTLGLGAILSLVIFPPVVAAVAIYALAFGDGFSGLFGRVAGRVRPAFLRGKSVEGCLSCFTAVFVSAYLTTRNPVLAVLAALVAMVVEALPLRDWDNIIFPLAVGLAVLPLSALTQPAAP